MRAQLSFPTRSEYDIFSANLELSRWFGGHGGLKTGVYDGGISTRNGYIHTTRGFGASSARTLCQNVFGKRHPPDSESAGEDAAESRRTTIYLLPPRNLVGAHVAQFFRSPRNYFSAFKLAWKNCPPGTKAITRQAAYFAEAGILAQGMAKHSLSHLHNHFADSSCSVASIAAEMAGFTFSFTIHGPAEFFETRLWWIDEKIKRALFVNCISYYCRSPAMSGSTNRDGGNSLMLGYLSPSKAFRSKISCCAIAPG